MDDGMANLISSQPVEEDPPVVEPDQMEIAEEVSTEEAAEDELDIPTFLRNERQLFQ